MGWTLEALAKAAGAQIIGHDTGHGAGQVQIAAIGTDSRSLPGNALFVALRGETFDGHGFVDAAVQAGARAVLVEASTASQEAVPPRVSTVPHLIVPDTLKALGDMAAWVRRAANRPVAAVTGSNGKTTTKELLAAALAGRRPVHKTAGNLNNLIGLPLTIFAWPEECWAAVLEMGMSAPGEIARLTAIAQPNVGLVTCVAPAHLGGHGLGSVESIARAKSEMYAELSDDAVAVVNADDAVLLAAAKPLLGKRRVLYFGTGRNADVRLTTCSPRDNGLDIGLHLDGKDISCRLPLIGRHNGLNAAAAAAAAWALGVSAEDIGVGLVKVKVPGARLLLHPTTAAGVTVLDDTYNANPGSMAAAFTAQIDIAEGRRRIVAVGDMLELGPTSKKLHHEAGAAAAAAGVAAVFALGEFARDVVEGARQAGARGTACDSVEALCQAVAAELRGGDVLLVKGSRGMRMERLVQFVLGSSAAGAH